MLIGQRLKTSTGLNAIGYGKSAGSTSMMIGGLGCEIVSSKRRKSMPRAKPLEEIAAPTLRKVELT